MEEYPCRLCYAEDVEIFYLCRRSIKHVFCLSCIRYKHKQAYTQRTDFRCPCCQAVVQKFVDMQRPSEEVDELTQLLKSASIY